VAQGQGKRLADHLRLERAGDIGPRSEGEIGIQTLRGGDNPGEHTIYFIAEGERVELVHRSATRDHFARGAVRAAAWIVGKPAGLYSIAEVLGLDA
jgi:4-hydroxy-tetrahydrodipicolinate reductase